MIAQLRIVSYNVLADAYASKRLYPRVAPAVLDWARRRVAVVTRVVELQPDVACLQEVQAEHWPALEQSFAEHGLSGVFAQKRQRRVDGCALLYRADAMQLVHCDALYFDDGIDGSPSSGHLAIIGIFETAIGPLRVASTHLRWQAETEVPDAHIGFRQAQELIRHYGSENLPASVVCGDFNIDAEHPAIELISTSGLRDAYAHRPQPTCSPHMRPTRIDFIFASPELKPVGEPLPELDAAQPPPNAKEPSDHLPITAIVSSPRLKDLPRPASK